MEGELDLDRRSPARFRRYAQGLPQRYLRFSNSFIRHQYDALNELLCDGKHEISDPARRQRIGGDASGGRIDWLSGLECAGQGGRGFGFDSDDAAAAREPRRDSADQAASADRHQQRVVIRSLLFEFEADRALAQQGLDLLVGMDRQRTRLRHPLLARR